MYEDNISRDSTPEIDQNLDQLIDWLESDSSPQDRGHGFGPGSPTELPYLNKVD